MPYKTGSTYRTESKRLLLDFLDKLDKREKQEFLTLSKNWTTIGNKINPLIDKLAKVEVKTQDQLFRLDLYKQFLKETKTIAKAYSTQAAEIISGQQLEFGLAGIGITQTEISLVTVNFNRLPINAITTFVGRSREGTPLFNLLMASYPETTTQITDTLLTSVALGRNPRVTAQLMQENMDGNLMRALRIARTEQMNTFRDASVMQMEQSGVVDEWERIEEDDACDWCAEQDGKTYSLSESFDTHPNCRGGTLPVIH